MNESRVADGALNRIVVVGSTGAGKTTLARALCDILGLHHVELDALHWDPGWTAAPVDVFRQRVEQALRDDRWVVDGNYRVVRDIVWGRASTVVWLDYALPLIFWRLLRRTIARVGSGEELWNGNRERFRDAFLSRNSLFLWALRTYGRRRREYSALFKRPEYANLAVILHRSPKDTHTWLADLQKQLC